MKKVAFFWFNNNYYVIPYNWKRSEEKDLVDGAEAYLLTADIKQENEFDNADANMFNTGSERHISFDDTKEHLRRSWILSHDKSHLIATTDKSLGDYPTIDKEIISDYDANWDCSFMFPYAGEVINGVIQLEVRKDSDS